MNEIEFADFKKLVIKIATIKSAEFVEGSKKLVKMTLDLGEEKGQIVAGVAEYYDPEFLVGKQVPILVNLEPKTLMGVESKGMMLAADEDGKPVLLHPDKSVKPGSVVR